MFNKSEQGLSAEHLEVVIKAEDEAEAFHPEVDPFQSGAMFHGGKQILYLYIQKYHYSEVYWDFWDAVVTSRANK